MSSPQKPGESSHDYLLRLAEENKAKREAKTARGRAAILDTAEDWTSTKPPLEDPIAEGADGDAGGGPPGDDEPLFDYVKMPRFFGKIVRSVPISMPDEAPITCLGKNGRVYSYLTPQGQLVELTDAEHGQAHIESLWAPEIGLLHKAFPQFDQQRKFKGFQAQYARAAMMAACALKPIFDAHAKVRGLGCWKDEDGHLVQHLGDVVLVAGKENKPGEIGPYVYPGSSPVVRPDPTEGREACAEIYRRLQGWNHARGEVDARLLLGFLGSAVLGAAIEWRPMTFITGDKSTGKSTLQRMIRALLVGRMVGTVDASEAALRGLIGQDSKAISFDEIEADATNDKAQQVMKLARTAASGDDAYRSSQSQTIKSFTLRGSFIFSAIIPPSMRQADMARFTFFRMQPLTKGMKPPVLNDVELRKLGARLVGRITGQWTRWEATLAAFSEALQAQGHEHRGALQFGTLLASAHMMLEDAEPDAADLTTWCALLKREGLFEYENSTPSWLQAWQHLMSAQPDAWRNEGSPTVAEMVRRYLDHKNVAGVSNSKDERALATAIHDKLGRAGLAVTFERETGRACLAIPPRHRAIAAIYKGSDFQANGGDGAWNIPLVSAPMVIGGDGSTDRRLNRGVQLKAEKVPRLGRHMRCTRYWLDGQADIGGVWTPIFERYFNDDEDEDDDGGGYGQPQAAPEAAEREPGEEG